MILGLLATRSGPARSSRLRTTRISDKSRRTTVGAVDSHRGGGMEKDVHLTACSDRYGSEDIWDWVRCEARHPSENDDTICGRLRA